MEVDEEKEDPSLVFTKSVMGQIQKEDVLSMVVAQREMLTRFEKTNEMLLNFNMLSGTRYETTMQEFKKHTTLLYEMKKDLDAIFRRIRLLKGRLSSLHPEAFSACSDVYNVLEEKNGDKAEDGEASKDTEEDDNKVTTSADVKSDAPPAADISSPNTMEHQQQENGQGSGKQQSEKEQFPEQQNPGQEQGPHTETNS